MRIKIFTIVLFGAMLTGCATYRPSPITEADINRALNRSQEVANDNLIIEPCDQSNHAEQISISSIFSKKLSEKELAELAVAMSPDLKALRAKEGVANAQVFDAGLLPDPQIALSYGHHLNSIPGVTDSYSYGLNWDIGGIATRWTKLKIANAQAEQIRYDIAWQEWLTANQAEILAIRIFYLAQQLRIANQASDSAKKILEITKSNLEQNNATIDEFGLRQATYLDFIDRAITLNRTLKRSVLQLNALLGLPPEKKIAFKIKPIVINSKLNAEKIFEEAQKRRLDLLALRAGYTSQEAKLYQAILGQFPHVAIGINKARDNTDVHTNGIGINFDIPIFNRNRGNIAIAEATREQFYLEYIARLNQTRSDIATLIVELELTSNEEKILNTELPKMREAEYLMRHGLESGNITLITYQNVLTNLLTNELRLLFLRQSLAEQFIALQIARGNACVCF